jgi:hypothetical protein
LTNGAEASGLVEAIKLGAAKKSCSASFVCIYGVRISCLCRTCQRSPPSSLQKPRGACTAFISVASRRSASTCLQGCLRRPRRASCPSARARGGRARDLQNGRAPTFR